MKLINNNYNYTTFCCQRKINHLSIISFLQRKHMFLYISVTVNFNNFLLLLRTQSFINNLIYIEEVHIFIYQCDSQIFVIKNKPKIEMIQAISVFVIRAIFRLFHITKLSIMYLPFLNSSTVAFVSIFIWIIVFVNCIRIDVKCIKLLLWIL